MNDEREPDMCSQFVIRKEVEIQMRWFYDNILQEVDAKIEIALRSLQPSGLMTGRADSQVLDRWQNLGGSFRGQSIKVDSSGTYKALAQEPANSASLAGELTSRSFDESLLVGESTARSIDDALAIVEENARDDSIKRRMSESQNHFITTWLELVEAGEIDIYTCLGLSNAFTNTPDTRKIWAKAMSVATMQLVIPLIMIFAEVEHGMTIHPCVDNLGFRFIGAVLYTYSVYTMYCNANCASRSELSNMMAEYPDVPMGFWLPLVIGELLNVIVAVILVITLYQIYTHQSEPADLILNAVAVNFLGSVDGELVNEEMKIDAISNFKQLAKDTFNGPTSSGKDYDPDDESFTDLLIRYALYGVALAGCAGAVVFFSTSTALNPEDQVHHGMRHAGLGNQVGKETLRI